jgi:hypothetical protein
VIRSHPFLVALAPVASTIGARIVGPDDRQHGDVALRWEGELVGYLRMPTAASALDRLIYEVEDEMGQEISELNKDGRQRAVKLLDERGAFSLRKSVDEVADVLGVSRITIYNYLNAVRKDPTHRSGGQTDA